MVLWLLLSNRLWERAGHTAAAEVFVYYNLSTLLTLFLCVLGLYLALFVVILAASLVVIDPDFMAEIMEEPVGFSNYVDIAWLSAAMGVVAGGLGTSFDESTDLRQLTQGRREMRAPTTVRSAADPGWAGPTGRTVRARRRIAERAWRSPPGTRGRRWSRRLAPPLLEG